MSVRSAEPPGCGRSGCGTPAARRSCSSVSESMHCMVNTSGFRMKIMQVGGRSPFAPESPPIHSLATQGQTAYLAGVLSIPLRYWLFTPGLQSPPRGKQRILTGNVHGVGGTCMIFILKPLVFTIQCMVGKSGPRERKRKRAGKVRHMCGR